MNIIVTGGSSGLGACIMRHLSAIPECSAYDVGLETGHDLTKVDDVQEVFQIAARMWRKVDVLINCAGCNYLNWIEDITEQQWDLVMDTNAKAIFLMTKYFAPLLRGGTIVNIVSNASHVPMTHSLAYNASKGAAAIMTRQMAKELWRTHGITVFGVSPNKLQNTGMTEHVDKRAAELRGMTPTEAHTYQMSKLLIGLETDPDCVAEFIVWLLSKRERHKYLAGCILEYGA